MDFKEMMKFVMEKMKEVWIAMGEFWGQLIDWFEKVFPAETRGEKVHHWLAVALPFMIAGAVLITLCCCCYKCCCSSCRGRGRVRTMKAPGRNCRMPRSAFESNPRSYFQNLRAYPGDELC